MWENLTFAQQVSLQNSSHLHDLIGCSPSLVADVYPKRLSNCSFLHAETLLSWKVKVPTENVQSCLVHTQNPSSFLKILFKENIIFASSSQERGGGREAEQSSSGKESLPGGPGRTVYVEDNWQEVPLAVLRVMDTLMWPCHLLFPPEVEPVEKIVGECVVCSLEDDVC